MIRVAVKHDVLQWALDRAGATPLDVAGKFPRISQWLAGESQPTLKQVEALAKTTLTPVGFFFLDQPPVQRLPIPHFRTVQAEIPVAPSPELLETVYTMQRRQAWMSEFLIEDGQERIPLVHSARLDEDVTPVAERIRDALGLRQGWANEQPTWTDALRVLREKIEQAGILTVVNGIVGNNTHHKLDPDEFRGFVLVDDYAPLVFVNGADGKAAQMFTLAHELAHVAFGSSAAFDLREMQPAADRTEQACNRVAAEFLVPERELRELWPSVRGQVAYFQYIARQFKVSEIVAARRLLDLELISRSVFDRFYREYQEANRAAAARQSGGGDFYLNQNQRVGRRFGNAVVRAAKEGRLPYLEAYRLIGLYGITFDKFASSLEGGSAE